MSKDPRFNEPLFSPSEFGISERAGVYALCVYDIDTPNGLRVVYIGASQNMRIRVGSVQHIYRRMLNIFKNYAVTVMTYDCHDYCELEKFLIRKYCPRFNKMRYV